MFVTLLLIQSLLRNSFHLLHEKPQSFRHLTEGLLLLLQSYYEIRQYVGHTFNMKCRTFCSKFIFSDLFLGVVLMRKCNYQKAKSLLHASSQMVQIQNHLLSASLPFS